MHPSISALPSKCFYEDRIINDKSVIERPIHPDLTNFEQVLKGRRLLFIDLLASYDQLDYTGSKCNHLEVAMTLGITNLLSAPDKVGVITPYKSQVRLLRSKLKDYDVNTVDSFQGQEREVIIFNCVRSNLQNYM